eukprot:293135-Rhodomonas_salina.1
MEQADWETCNMTAAVSDHWYHLWIAGADTADTANKHSWVWAGPISTGTNFSTAGNPLPSWTVRPSTCCCHIGNVGSARTSDVPHSRFLECYVS